MVLKKSSLDLLAYLASKGGTTRFIGETTASLADSIRVPQQSVSRWVIELEENGFIERGDSGYKLTQKAVDALHSLFADLTRAFGEKRVSRLEGVVVKGIGDGQFYMSRKDYLQQFKKALGFTPFPGTLNIRLKGAEDVAERMKMSKSEGTRIHGFVKEKQVFGGATCFPAVLSGETGKAEGAVVVPDRTHYGMEIAEFICEKNLRKSLSLKDGEPVSIEFFYPKAGKATHG